jgi:phosphate transport system permease protein
VIEQGAKFFTAPPPTTDLGLGGIGTVLQGSLVLVATALAFAAPISVLAGAFIAFYPNSFTARLARQLAEVVVEFPTIVIGVSVFGLFIVDLHLGLSALTGAIALAVVITPYMTIQISEALRVPRAMFEESLYALGMSRLRTMLFVMSAGRRGLLTGLLIGMAKGFGETAALLFTITTSFNLFFTSFNRPVSAIPVLIYFYGLAPYENWREVAWGAAFVLTVLVLALFSIVRVLARGGMSR